MCNQHILIFYCLVIAMLIKLLRKIMSVAIHRERLICGVLRSGVECTEAGRGVLVCRAADRQIDVVLTPLRDDE